jgi:DNA-directed RNA polymerase specialized sigma24 family protein
MPQYATDGAALETFAVLSSPAGKEHLNETWIIAEMDTPVELDNLLRWLGPDVAKGAQQYVEVRKRLISLFEFRGSESPEELADETLDRTARAIMKPGFTFDGNPIAYMRGVARNVWLESRRRNHPVSQESLPELADTLAQSAADTPEKEQIFGCLDRCLARMPSNKRGLLLRYYQGEKSEKIDGRMRLAQETGLELNALRLQVFRLRSSIRQCVESCVNWPK